MKASQIKNKQYWKQRIKSQVQRKNFKKQIFGDHYNFESVRLNRNKKYFNEEIKIMEIEKSNRLLLQKIKKIAQRSRPRNIIQKARTQVLQNQPIIGRSSTQERLNTKKDLTIRKHRYQSVQSILQKTRVRNIQNISKRNNQSQNQQTLNKIDDRIMIYKGNKKISNILFQFKIYIEKGVYKIQCKTKISQQKIQIPEDNYNVLLKQQLLNDHKNIFKHLKLCQNNKLQIDFKQSKKIQVDIFEKRQIELPFINNKTIDRINTEPLNSVS